jgi:hypothetical protein
MARNWTILAVSVVLAVGAAFVFWPRTSHVSKAGCDSIKIGVTRAQVEEFLGGPPGDYRTVCTTCSDLGEADLDDIAFYVDLSRYAAYSDYCDDGHYAGAWFGNEGIIEVDFASDVVVAKWFLPATKKQQAFFDNLAWLLRRQWRRWSST